MGAVGQNQQMNKIFTFLIAALTFILVMGCTTRTQLPDNLRREWKLVEFRDFTKEMMMSNKAGMNLTADGERPGQYGASMGCNNMFFQAEFAPNGTVKFSKMGSTMMYCDRAMDLEAAFAADLPTMTQYKVEGHYLTLTSPQGSRMKFVAADWD